MNVRFPSAPHDVFWEKLTSVLLTGVDLGTMQDYPSGIETRSTRSSTRESPVVDLKDCGNDHCGSMELSLRLPLSNVARV